MTRAELQTLMLHEVARLSAPARPQSTRLSQCAAAQPVLATAAAAAVPAPGSWSGVGPAAVGAAKGSIEGHRSMDVDDVPPAPGAITGGGNRYAPSAPGKQSPAAAVHVPTGAGAMPQASRADAGGPDLLAALSSHMRELKADLLSHVDRKVDALVARIDSLERGAPGAGGHSADHGRA